MLLDPRAPRPYTIDETTRVTRTRLRAEWDTARAADYDALLQMVPTDRRPEAVRIVSHLEQTHAHITHALRDNWLQEAQRAHVIGYFAGTSTDTPPPISPDALDEAPIEGEKGPIH